MLISSFSDQSGLNFLFHFPLKNISKLFCLQPNLIFRLRAVQFCPCTWENCPCPCFDDAASDIRLFIFYKGHGQTARKFCQYRTPTIFRTVFHYNLVKLEFLRQPNRHLCYCKCKGYVITVIPMDNMLKNLPGKAFVLLTYVFDSLLVCGPFPTMENFKKS